MDDPDGDVGDKRSGEGLVERERAATEREREGEAEEILWGGTGCGQD